MTTKNKHFWIILRKNLRQSLRRKIKVNDEGDLKNLLDDLGWDYQRMSRSGREVYDEIQQLLGGLPENEVWMEI